MTTQTETTKEKQVPSFYIFANGADGKKGPPVGAAFAHKKGSGYSLIVNGTRYAAFPPKAKTAAATATADATAPQPEATGEKGA